MLKSILLGAGRSRLKKVALPGQASWQGDLVTVDMDPSSGADVVWNLDTHPLPFEDESAIELAAYDVLEHLGRQGDWRGFFDEFAEYWRVLAPGGTFGIIVPINKDALADPGHTRFFSGVQFCFLNQKWYEDQHAKGTVCTDYRWYWKRDFEIRYLEEIGGHHLAVVLQKPEGGPRE